MRKHTKNKNCNGKKSTVPEQKEKPGITEKIRNILHDRQIHLRSLASLKPWPGNARKHSDRQIVTMMDTIRALGFSNPLLVNEDNTILCGHGRHEANGGMSSFYRSKHELVFVFKNGKAAHINNFGLGGNGRYRTNVWDYSGVNTFKTNRADELTMHPTVKPVGLVADAIRDCSKRKGLILDPFSGSGTLILAAERTGRIARCIELDPTYADVTIARWIRVHGKPVTHAETGQSFDEVRKARLESPTARKEVRDGR